MTYRKLADTQTVYTLRVYRCLPLLDSVGQQVDNSMIFRVEKPFILLHAFIADNSDDEDRDSNLEQGLTNALLYLENHPIVQVANVANISNFAISANQYIVNDIRKDKMTDRQFVFVLLCENF
ncbi:hypothetical protein [Dysgonomonas sp. GY617]|uniref:hypothetical protein n=1 Tax=Dysgonomonas sp. GY617 TaxID=2780420 RepID=UPI0018834D3B|nr:hypothetical protein [Dysgonomonas sp. GY617]MBF0574406.1 hypothetical protein [Dysgonomonas sp. GY617]